MMTNKPAQKKKPLPRWIKWIWLITNALVIPFLCIWAIFFGVVVGYVYLGGQELSDVMLWETWQHVYNLVFSDA